MAGHPYGESAVNTYLELILTALQEGEISRARAVECIEALEVNHFTRTWIPEPSGYFTQDEVPMDVVKALRAAQLL